MTPTKLIKFKIRNEKTKNHFLMIMPLNKPMAFTEIVNGFVMIEKDLEPEFQKYYSILRISAYLNNVLVKQGIVKKEEEIFTRIK